MRTSKRITISRIIRLYRTNNPVLAYFARTYKQNAPTTIDPVTVLIDMFEGILALIICLFIQAVLIATSYVVLWRHEQPWIGEIFGSASPISLTIARLTMTVVVMALVGYISVRIVKGLGYGKDYSKGTFASAGAFLDGLILLDELMPSGIAFDKLQADAYRTAASQHLRDLASSVAQLQQISWRSKEAVDGERDLKHTVHLMWCLTGVSKHHTIYFPR